MFSKFKEKLGSWTKKISKDKEKDEVVEEKPEKKEKEVPTPMKFNAGMKQYQPDLDAIKEVEDELLEEEKEGSGGGRGIPSQDGEVSKSKNIFKKFKTTKISEQEFEVYSEELQTLLLENNVAFEVAEKIIQELKDEIVGKELLKKEIEEEIKDSFKEIIRRILVEPFNIEDKIKQKSGEPYVILFCGVNGTGKTTSIAKLAHSLKNQNISCVLAAGDTFRAAAVEQLKQHGEKLGIKVISQNYGSDAAAVGFDAIQYAKKNRIQCVLIDTAGRMHTSKDLLREIEKIVKVTKPDLKIFVGESLTGNDAIEQAKSFNWSVNIDGIILTKSDVDEKGGTSLSVGHVTKKPILYLGTGQNFGEIEKFDKEEFIKRLGL